MGLLPDTWNCGLRMRRECRERFPRHWLQRKPLVSDSGMHHGTCVTHVPWCMSRSLTRDGGDNVLGIPGACATRNFTYLVRGLCTWSSRSSGHPTDWIYCWSHGTVAFHQPILKRRVVFIFSWIRRAAYAVEPIHPCLAMFSSTYFTSLSHMAWFIKIRLNEHLLWNTFF